MKNNSTILLIILIAFLIISSCAGPNPALNTPDSGGDVAGFWNGLVHGLIAPVTFVISLFKDSVSMYDVHNNGGWYDLGFALGAMIIVGGGGRSSRRKKS